MAEQVFKLDIECHEDGRSKQTIRVPIGGDEPVRRLLEKVRERTKMNGLTSLYTVRDGQKALLDPGDTLYLVLDAGENRLRAEATPATSTVATTEPPRAPVPALALSAKASAPPPPRADETLALGLRSRSRSPARRKANETACLLELRDRQRSCLAALLMTRHGLEPVLFLVPLPSIRPHRQRRLSSLPLSLSPSVSAALCM